MRIIQLIVPALPDAVDTLVMMMLTELLTNTDDDGYVGVQLITHLTMVIFHSSHVSRIRFTIIGIIFSLLIGNNYFPILLLCDLSSLIT